MELHDRLLGESLSSSDPELQASYQLYLDIVADKAARDAGRNVSNTGFCVPEWLEMGLDYSAGEDPNYVMAGWRGMLVYFLTDYRYLYE